jgi:hypothetical protein
MHLLENCWSFAKVGLFAVAAGNPIRHEWGDICFVLRWAILCGTLNILF